MQNQWAVTSANYSINIEDKQKASAMFIKRKPLGAVVYPTEASLFGKLPKTRW